MPKKNKTITLDPSTVRELEDYATYDLAAWAESLASASSGGALAREEVNEVLAELLTLLSARDALIEGGETGVVPVVLLKRYAAEFVRDVKNDLPEMNVPQGTLAYHASRTKAAFQVDRAMAALA